MLAWSGILPDSNQAGNWVGAACMVFLRLFGRSSHKVAASRLYDATVNQSRRPVFYENIGVPDTINGRFGMIVLHASLILNRLRRIRTHQGRKLTQSFFDTMFHDIENNLRELGYADASLGKRVKGMIAGFYGQSHIYEQCLAVSDDRTLYAALRRNVFELPADTENMQTIEVMVDYVRQQAENLAVQDDAALHSGSIIFETPLL